MHWIRTLGLMTALTVLLVVAGGLVGGRSGAVIAFGMAAVGNFVSFWWSDKLVLRRYQAREAAPDSRLYRITEELAERAGLPMPRVYVLPQQTANAFATGRSPSHAAVAATEGILRLLDDDELAGVMAHELAHIENRDILTGTVAATLAGAIAMLGQFSRVGRLGGGRRAPRVGAMLAILGAPFAAMLLRMAVSRAREYAADEGGARISGRPMALASALNRLHQGVQEVPLRRGNAAHAHLFIVNPFGGGLQRLFATHPPVYKRIQRLEELAGSHRGS